MIGPPPARLGASTNQRETPASNSVSPASHAATVSSAQPPGGACGSAAVTVGRSGGEAKGRPAQLTKPSSSANPIAPHRPYASARVVVACARLERPIGPAAH